MTASPAPQRALTARERLDVLLLGSDAVKTGWAAHLTDQLMPLVEELVREGKAEVWSLAASWVGPPFANEFRDRATALRGQP